MGKYLKRIKLGLRLLVGLRSEQGVIEAKTGLEQASRIRPGDVIIVGYPKSGNTWVQYMLADIAFNLDVSRSRDEVIQALVPEVDGELDSYYRRYGDSMFFRSHAFPRPEYRRVIYLCRDGRDVLASYVKFLRHWERNKNLMPRDLIDVAGRGLPSWEEHLKAWEANPYAAEILKVRYEDLRSDPDKELRRMCEFSGLERTDEEIARSIKHTQFEAMQDREKKYGWSASFPQEGFFVRRGEVGSYRDELSKEDQALFLQRAEPVLRRLGYIH